MNWYQWGEETTRRISLRIEYSDICTHAGNNKQRYVDHPRGWSQLTCLINGLGHSSDECRVLNGFGTKYAKYRPFKESSQDTNTNKKWGKKQEVNYFVQEAVDEIILQENEKLN